MTLALGFRFQGVHDQPDGFPAPLVAHLLQLERGGQQVGAFQKTLRGPERLAAARFAEQLVDGGRVPGTLGLGPVLENAGGKLH